MKLLDNAGRLEELFASSGIQTQLKWLAPYPWRLLHLQKWDYLCRQGERVGHLVLFLQGTLAVSVSIPHGRCYLVSFCEPGTLVCGDVEVCIGGSCATADIRAEEISWCAVIPLDPFRETLLSDLEFLRYVCRRLGSELVKDSFYAANNLLAPLEERLACYLLHTAREGCFCGNLTRVSELMGVSYRQLARVMRAFRERGYIVKEGSVWRLTDQKALRSLGMSMATP